MGKGKGGGGLMTVWGGDLQWGSDATSMLKVEFHAHTADDPQDFIPHSTVELIDRAVALGYGALAITLHDRQLDLEDVTPYARERGIVLIPGIEKTIRGKHVLLINFRTPVDQIQNFDDLVESRRRSGGLVIAPHPFFPLRSCLHGVMDQYPALFDAVEVNGFYTATVNFNRRGTRWAAAHSTPTVGNGDVHRLSQLGRTFSLVESERDPDAICDAVKRGSVEVRTQPLSWSQCGRVGGSMLLADVWPFARARRQVPASP